MCVCTERDAEGRSRELATSMPHRARGGVADGWLFTAPSSILITSLILILFLLIELLLDALPEKTW